MSIWSPVCQNLIGLQLWFGVPVWVNRSDVIDKFPYISKNSWNRHSTTDKKSDFRMTPHEEIWFLFTSATTVSRFFKISRKIQTDFFSLNLRALFTENNLRVNCETGNRKSGTTKKKSWKCWKLNLLNIQKKITVLNGQEIQGKWR